MKNKVIIVLMFIILLNLILVRIYVEFAKRKFFKKVKSISENSKSKSVNKFAKFIKDYLNGFIFLLIRLTGLIPSFTIRHFIYKNFFLLKIGKGSKIRACVEFSSPWNIEIGENSMIGQECKLDGRNGLYIGNHVNISDCTAIWTEQHDINDENFACNNKGGKVIIEDRVWLGFRSVVLPNIHIKEGVVLATGAIATKDCEDFSLYAGIPAVKKTNRNRNINYKLDISGMHFI